MLAPIYRVFRKVNAPIPDLPVRLWSADGGSGSASHSAREPILARWDRISRGIGSKTKSTPVRHQGAFSIFNQILLGSLWRCRIWLFRGRFASRWDSVVDFVGEAEES